MTPPSQKTLQHQVPAVRACEVLRAPAARWIDLRSPGEFALDHAPGAVNVPLFDDLERRLIGTLYARSSPESAFAEGRRRARAKIVELVADISRAAGWDQPAGDLERLLDELSAGGIEGMEAALDTVPMGEAPADCVAFSCWRGGLRSRSVVAMLRALGLPALVIEGGYKAYRAQVRATLDGWEAPPSFVLRGWTGVGKTLILTEIERLRPWWTIDLEGLAGHRSSILGMVGKHPVSQKAFESALSQRLAAGLPGRCVFEGESRKVGDVILPPRLWSALEGGINIRLETSLDRRVEVLVTDYLAEPGNRGELRGQLPFIERRLGKKWDGELVQLLDAGREEELVAVLLQRYYDPLYQHSEKGRTYAVTLDASDPNSVAEKIVSWIEAH